MLRAITRRQAFFVCHSHKVDIRKAERVRRSISPALCANVAFKNVLLALDKIFDPTFRVVFIDDPVALLYQSSFLRIHDGSSSRSM